MAAFSTGQRNTNRSGELRQMDVLVKYTDGAFGSEPAEVPGVGRFDRRHSTGLKSSSSTLAQVSLCTE